MSTNSFGRRTTPKPPPAPLPVMTKFVRPGTVHARAEPSPGNSVEDELRA
jgi:hypothetical protein